MESPGLTSAPILCKICRPRGGGGGGDVQATMRGCSQDYHTLPLIQTLRIHLLHCQAFGCAAVFVFLVLQVLTGQTPFLKQGLVSKDIS